MTCLSPTLRAALPALEAVTWSSRFIRRRARHLDVAAGPAGGTAPDHSAVMPILCSPFIAGWSRAGGDAGDVHQQ